jgi:hypothetical protein
MTSTTFRLVGAALIGLLVTACASARPAGTAYTGQVYIVDKQENTITLYQNGSLVRVSVTPDQLRGLQLWQTATVYGQPAPPTQIERMTSTGRIAGPKGPAEQMEIMGTVAAVDPAGIIVITTASGPVKVWTASPGTSLFRAGDRVRARLGIQALEVAQTPAGGTPPAAWAPAPMAPATAPGEYAVVVGPVVSADPAGRLVVQTTRGPVEMMAQSRDRYRQGDMVEVRSAVQPAP